MIFPAINQYLLGTSLIPKGYNPQNIPSVSMIINDSQFYHHESPLSPFSYFGKPAFGKSSIPSRCCSMRPSYETSPVSVPAAPPAPGPTAPAARAPATAPATVVAPGRAPRSRGWRPWRCPPPRVWRRWSHANLGSMGSMAPQRRHWLCYDALMICWVKAGALDQFGSNELADSHMCFLGKNGCFPPFSVESSELKSSIDFQPISHVWCSSYFF